MTGQYPGSRPSRVGLRIARAQLVVAVLLLVAVRSHAVVAQALPLDVDSTPPTVSITSPAGTTAVATPLTGTVTIRVTASDAVGVKSVTFLVDGTTIGTDTSSPYSLNWNTGNVASGSHSLRAEARDAAGNVGTSKSVSVTVVSETDKTPPSETDKTPPRVSLTSPLATTQVTGITTIRATASDTVGVTLVTFRVDGAVIGTDTSSPYSLRWDTGDAAPGLHTLRAEARDAAGNVGTSKDVTVTVTVGANKRPSVTLTAPALGSTYETPAVITLTANATDSDGSVARVEFYEGSSLIGSLTKPPFTFIWTVNVAGTYVFSAKAVDNAGAVRTSAKVSVRVGESPRPATAVFEPPANDGEVIRYVLDIFTKGADPALSTPAATQNLGKPPVVKGESTADISQALGSLRPGTYFATVTAVGSTDRSRSAPSPSFVVASSNSVSASSIGAYDDTVDTMPSEEDAPVAASSATEAHGVLWVVSSSTSMVTAFDATTGDVLATIPVGLNPAGIAAPHGVGKVYVADEGSDTVSVISKATMTLAGTIPLPAPFGRRPHHVSASPDGRFVYVGERGANVVDVIDTSTDQVTARFSAGWPGSTTLVVVPDPRGDVLYAVSRATTGSVSTLVALEAATGRWLWQMPIDGDPRDFMIGSDGRTGIMTRRADNRIALIDLERHAVANDIDLGAGNEAATLQLSADGRFVIVTLRPAPVRVGIVDLETRTLRTVPLGGPAIRNALPAGHLSYVCVSDSSDVPPGCVAVDATSHTIVNRFRLPGGGSPRGVVFDPPGAASR